LVKLEKAIEAKEKLEKKQVVAELKAVAKKHGFALADLLNETQPVGARRAINSKPNKVDGRRKKTASAAAAKTTAPKKRAKAKIKFRNPSNGSETWTGRGRQPRWVVEYVKMGGELSQLSA